MSVRWRGIAALTVPLAVAALLCVSVGAARVEGRSMDPTLAEGSPVLFDRVLPPTRGDLVVFACPDGWTADGDLLVKRVIGTPGDAVRCCEAGSGRLLVNDVPVDESYVTADRPGGSARFEITVPAGALWVMGDNRSPAGSHDSREELSGTDHGMLDADDVRGVVRLAF